MWTTARWAGHHFIVLNPMIAFALLGNKALREKSGVRATVDDGRHQPPTRKHSSSDNGGRRKGMARDSYKRQSKAGHEPEAAALIYVNWPRPRQRADQGSLIAGAHSRQKLILTVAARRTDLSRTAPI